MFTHFVTEGTWPVVGGKFFCGQESSGPINYGPVDGIGDAFFFRVALYRCENRSSLNYIRLHLSIRQVFYSIIRMDKHCNMAFGVLG